MLRSQCSSKVSAVCNALRAGHTTRDADHIILMPGTVSQESIRLESAAPCQNDALAARFHRRHVDSHTSAAQNINDGNCLNVLGAVGHGDENSPCSRV